MLHINTKIFTFSYNAFFNERNISPLKVRESSICVKIKLNFSKITTSNNFFLGANAPLGPASSEGLYVCLSVCLYVTL